MNYVDPHGNCFVKPDKTRCSTVFNQGYLGNDLEPEDLNPGANCGIDLLFVPEQTS